MKPRAIALVVLCALSIVLLGHQSVTSSREATVVPVVDTSRHFGDEPTRSYNRFLDLALDEHGGGDFVPPTTTTTVAPTTTTTVRRTTITTVHRTTTTRLPTITTAPPVRPAAASGDRAPCLRGKVSIQVAHTCWDGLLAQYPWSVSKAFSVLYCESTGWAYNSNGIYHGLMEIENGPMDPDANIALAYNYYQRRGWQPWSCA